MGCFSAGPHVFGTVGASVNLNNCYIIITKLPEMHVEKILNTQIYIGKCLI